MMKQNQFIHRKTRVLGTMKQKFHSLGEPAEVLNLMVNMVMVKILVSFASAASARLLKVAACMRDSS